MALDRGLLGGRSDYFRFIILGRGRSGSNFLRGLLNSHRQIITFGELFRFPESIGWEFPDHDMFLQSHSLLSLMQTDPGRFLEEQVYRKFPGHISAVGFKLFYYHAQDDPRKTVWSYLRGQEDLKIIHLKRNNTLRLIVSETKAFKTNRWTNTTAEQEETFTLALTYHQCLHRFLQEQAHKDQFDIFFNGHCKMDVIYEDLDRDYETEMKPIQAFLGVSYEAVKPLTYKQSNQPLREVISNYDELKKRFKGTRWAGFFEE